ncbi:MAG TPA: hypothetical protein PL001_00070 [Candidatus Kryptobacter bacterium]|nr:hypothetical protein [Candidatus Kryptobacter bacterium]
MAQEQHKEAEQSPAEAAGYEWFLKTDFMANMATLWEGVETVAAATAEAGGKNPEEFLSGCSNAFADAINDFLFGEEEAEGDEDEQTT